MHTTHTNTSCTDNASIEQPHTDANMESPPQQSPKYAQIAVSLPVDGLYTYGIPKELSVEIGQAVLVPFGPRTVSGYIMELTDSTDLQKIRYISKILDPQPVFEAKDIAFFQWIANYYLSGLGEVIATALPSDYKGGSIRTYIPTEEGVEAIARGALQSDNQASILRAIIAKPNRSSKGLLRDFPDLDHSQIKRFLDALCKKEYIRHEEKTKDGPKSKIKVAVLAVDTDTQSQVTGARAIAAINAINDAGGELDLEELSRLEGPTIRAAVKRLVEKGIIFIDEREDLRSAEFKTLPASSTPHPLNDQQEHAYKAMTSHDPNQPSKVYLLHGVTGAGKTEVFLQAAQHYLEQGKQSLILVPEIALTPLLIGRVKARFGERVACLHSGLSSTERLREWRRIRCGDADVAVGARSALFAPFPNLGLIIVDEEHDDSYKQGDGVRYHARDLAVVRGHMEKCPVVLASATPSVETWFNAYTNKYTLLRINKRATPKPVPKMSLIDMRGHPPHEIISKEVERALRETFANGGSAIVLFNRRGYAPVVECSGCGTTFPCPSCGINLVLHKRSQKLTCHYCSFYKDYDVHCPRCETVMDIIGYGTERVEEELRVLFPDVGISRMDADTTATKGAHHRILEEFRTGKSQLLLGTQLVAKGHDFPNVTMAAVIGVDHILTLPDFRSAERTYALVTQLAGRAGRGSQAGHVLVQTRHPDHFVFRLLSAKNIADPDHVFYQQEVRQRNILQYPPQSKLVLVILEGENKDKVRSESGKLAGELRQLSRFNQDISIIGPSMAPLSKLVGKFRVHILLRGNKANEFRKWLHQVRHVLRDTQISGIKITVDVDPKNLL